MSTVLFFFKSHSSSNHVLSKLCFTSFKNMAFPHDYVLFALVLNDSDGLWTAAVQWVVFVSLSVPQMPASQVSLPGPPKPTPPGHIISVLIDLAVFSLYACLSPPTSPWLAYSAIWFSNTNLPNLLPAKLVPPGSLLLSIPYSHPIRSLVLSVFLQLSYLRG